MPEEILALKVILARGIPTSPSRNDYQVSRLIRDAWKHAVAQPFWKRQNWVGSTLGQKTRTTNSFAQ